MGKHPESESVYLQVVNLPYESEPEYRADIKAILQKFDAKSRRISKAYGVDVEKLHAPKKKVSFSIVNDLKKVIDEPNLKNRVGEIIARYHYVVPRKKRAA